MIICMEKSDIKKTDVLVFRIFAPLKPNYIDRESEFLGLQLVDVAGCGTPILATFTNGVVLGYARGRMLTYTDFSNRVIMK